MMTVVTQVTLKTGCEPEWDAAMRERLAAARGQRGWVGGQLLIPLDGVNKRAVVGTWESRADWEAWHEDERFLESRKRMDGLQEGRSEMVWYEVVTEGRGAGSSSVGPPQ
ncbi:antibiotic biosynthesis monooxygenase family protein [Pseudonocardia cypriaca]|uniref:Heme-degrading monooxygenase HmoA n=1 Tax=Pseudonocardia cypriaca TaxID=882449 RepID=A0A543FW99_9PSEU|nr:antibiotic biosynthesis monooxygenase [Pseudonocardia cypriaca]TQM38118.1 heme-degrading monooxygenase HmoA [Pseudonocardia cypriaca]